MPPVQTKKYTPEQVNALNAARELNISQGLKSGAGASVAAATATPINQVSMGSLVRPQEPITVPQPKTSTPPSVFVQNLEPSIRAGQDGIIRAQTEEAAKRDDLLGRLLSTEVSSSQDVYNQAFQAQGGDKTLRELQDASTKLAQLQGKFRTAGQDISSGQGQSKAFEGVQLSELGREEAIQVGNQALVVQALQGNFDTARQIALDTSNFAIEDRKATLDNLYNQYNAIGTVVASQEAQLIDKERRRLDTLQDSVNSAISSGGASVEEMTELTSPNTTDEQKLSIAQSIVARTTRQDRELENAAKNASLAKSNYELNLLKNPPPTAGGLTPELQEEIADLSDKSRTDLVNASQTIEQLNRIKEIIATTDDLSTLTPATEVGREFERLSKDVADKMGRERTGAVVTDDEIKTFKSILGLGMFNKVISDDQEILKNLDSFINKHTATTNLIDPSGQIRGFLGTNSTDVSVEDSYLDTIVPILGGTNDLYGQFGI